MSQRARLDVGRAVVALVVAVFVGAGCGVETEESEPLADGDAFVAPEVEASTLVSDTCDTGLPIAVRKTTTAAHLASNGFWLQEAELENCTDQAVALKRVEYSGCAFAVPVTEVDAVLQLPEGAIGSFDFAFGATPDLDFDGDGQPGIAPAARAPMFLVGHPERFGTDPETGACHSRESALWVNDGPQSADGVFISFRSYQTVPFDVDIQGE